MTELWLVPGGHRRDAHRDGHCHGNATPTATSTIATTPSATPTTSGTCTRPSISMQVDPVTSPTTATTQTLSYTIYAISLGIESEAGRFNVPTGQHTVTIPLVANATNHLTVTASYDYRCNGAWIMYV